MDDIIESSEYKGLYWLSIMLYNAVERAFPGFIWIWLLTLFNAQGEMPHFGYFQFKAIHFYLATPPPVNWELQEWHLFYCSIKMVPQHVDTKSSDRLYIDAELKGEYHSTWDISGARIIKIFNIFQKYIPSLSLSLDLQKDDSKSVQENELEQW